MGRRLAEWPPLCSTHHDAYDAHLFAIDPDNLSIVTDPKISPTAIDQNPSLVSDDQSTDMTPNGTKLTGSRTV